jgi:enoyl-CoA hydratase/carnithine racemase
MSQHVSEHVAVLDADNVRTVAMRRPDKKNALTQDMYRAMTAALNSASGDDAVRCVLITGVPGAFSAGNDIGDFLNAASAGANAAIAFLHALTQCDKPIVASVGGLAVGIGTTMLFHCDHVVATPQAHFSTPFTQLGLVPEGGSSLLGPRQIGYHRAFSLLVMGRPLDAKAALDCGLVNTIAEDADAEGLKAAREIAALPPEAVKLSRELLRRPVAEIVTRIDDEAALFAERMRSPEANAAFKAFLSRKK